MAAVYKLLEVPIRHLIETAFYLTETVPACLTRVTRSELTLHP
jgi:hypothetical protein